MHVDRRTRATPRSLLPRLRRRPARRRRHPPARSTTPSSTSSRCSPRTSCCSSPAAHPLGRQRARSRWPSSPTTAAAAAAGHGAAPRSSTAAAAASASSCAPQAEIDGVRLLASLAFEGYGAAIVPATAVPALAARATSRRITVPELPRRVVGWAQRRRPAPGAPTAGRARRAPRGRSPTQGARPARRPRRRPTASPLATAPAPAPTVVAGRARADGRGDAARSHVVRAPRCRAPWSPRARAASIVARRSTVDGVVLASTSTPATRSGALSSESSRHARARGRAPPRAERLPARRACMRSSGADIVEGFAALARLGPRGPGARRLLGRRADDLRRRRPGRVRPGAAARPGRPRGDDRATPTPSSAARRWSPSSPACVVDTDELGGAGDPRPLHRRGRRSSSPTATRPSTPSPSCSRYLPPTQRRASRRAGRPTTRSTGRRPRPATLMPPTSTGSYDVRDVIRGDRRRRRAARAARPAGRPTW